MTSILLKIECLFFIIKFKRIFYRIYYLEMSFRSFFTYLFKSNKNTTYEYKFAKLIKKLKREYNDNYGNVVKNIEDLYNPVFIIMDYKKWQGQGTECNLIDIMTNESGQIFEILQNQINKEGMTEDFNYLITELQEDVNLIQAQGFAAFETKMINMLIEVKKDSEQFKSNCTEIISIIDEMIHKLFIHNKNDNQNELETD